MSLLKGRVNSVTQPESLSDFSLYFFAHWGWTFYNFMARLWEQHKKYPLVKYHQGYQLGFDCVHCAEVSSLHWLLFKLGRQKILLFSFSTYKSNRSKVWLPAVVPVHLTLIVIGFLFVETTEIETITSCSCQANYLLTNQQAAVWPNCIYPMDTAVFNVIV